MLFVLQFTLSKTTVLIDCCLIGSNIKVVVPPVSCMKLSRVVGVGSLWSWKRVLEHPIRIFAGAAGSASAPSKRYNSLSEASVFQLPVRRMNGNGGAGDGGAGSGSRGALIVLEGCDKAGKSTQCRLLVDALNKDGRKSHLFTFPDRTTEIGKVIDQYLKCNKSLSDEAIHLLFSSNRWELAPTIKDLLQKGHSVVLDRYAFSGVAFSAAKGTLDLEWCKAPDVGLPQPDIVLFLNLSEDAAAARGDYGQERYEKQEFQERVKNIFLQIQDPAYWKILDANQTKEEVHKQLLEVSENVIDSCHTKPILPLWRHSDNVNKDKDCAVSSML